MNMEDQTVMDTMTSDVSKPNDVMNLLQLNTSDDGQSDMVNNLELFNATVGGNETETTSLMESQSTIELNGERHVIVQETTDPETGELLVVLKSENGNHIALPSSVIQSGIVQMAAENQLEVSPQQELEQQQQPQELLQELQQEMQQEQQQDVPNELHQIVQQQDLQQAVQQELKQDEPVADPNMNPDITVNGVPEDTPVLQTTVLNAEMQPVETDGPEKMQQEIPEETTVAIIDDSGITTQETVDGQAVFTADAASLEALVANAMASGAAGGQDFVIMTEDASTIEAINATESVEVGQGDGTAVYAEQVVDNSSTQYVASNGSTEEMILNAMSQSGTLSDGQVIHAVVDNQTFAYTITATESGYQLIPMGPVTESPRSSPKKASPVARPSKAKQSPSGETLLVASARTDTISSGLKKRQMARPGTKPNLLDNQRFMGKAVALDNDSPSLLTATAPGPSQLASSRRTYSKKNVVWCNPESKTTKATFPNVTKPITKTAEPLPPPTEVVAQTASTTTTVSSPLKVAPVPTSSSSEKSKFAARATSPAKVPQVPPPKANPILIDDGKPAEEPKAQAAVTETRPKSPAKKENGILVQPVPKPAEEAVEKRAIRNRRSTSKTLAEEVLVEKVEEPVKEAKPESVVEKIIPEKERPSRIRKPTPKVAAAATSTKTPSNEEKVTPQETPAAESEPVAEPVVEKPATVRSSRKAKKQDEVKVDKVLDDEERTKELVDEKPKDSSKNKVEKEEVKKEEKIVEKDEKVVKKVEKTPKKVEEEPEVVEKKEEVSKSEDESVPVRRSSRAPKRKSIDDDVVEERKVSTAEKRTKTKDSEKKTAEEKKPLEEVKVPEKKSEKMVAHENELEKVVDDKKVEKTEPKEKSIVEESSTPRKRVGFSADVGKGEEPKDTKKRRTASTETKVTPSKEATPKKKSDVKPILKRTPGSALSTPKGRRLETPIVATFSPVDPEVENKLLKEVIETLNDQRSPDQRYDVTSPGCEIHVRHQSVTLTNYTPRGSGSSYACQKCGFRTSRMNNLIVHHKEQCPVAKNAQMMSWMAEIRKQTKTPPSSTVARRTSELSASSPDEEGVSPVPDSFPSNHNNSNREVSDEEI